VIKHPVITAKNGKVFSCTKRGDVIRQRGKGRGGVLEPISATKKQGFIPINLRCWIRFRIQVHKLHLNFEELLKNICKMSFLTFYLTTRKKLFIKGPPDNSIRARKKITLKS
jgi:hypothetical protein